MLFNITQNIIKFKIVKTCIYNLIQLYSKNRIQLEYKNIHTVLSMIFVTEVTKLLLNIIPQKSYCNNIFAVPMSNSTTKTKMNNLN